MSDALHEANAKRVDALRRSLSVALKGFEDKLTARDAAQLGGDLRRERQFAAEINQILARLDSEDALQAIGRPLGQAYGDGLRTADQGTSAKLTGPAVADGIDRDRLRALAEVVTLPLKSNLKSAKSPLAYVAPKLLAEEDRQKLIELSLQGTAQGMTTKQLAQLLANELPASRRLLRGEFEKGPTITNDGGSRVQVGRYAEMLARTTTYWASNRGVIDRATEAGIPCVKYTTAPGCHDFCLDLHNTIFAITEEAAEKYLVPTISEIPGGGVPTHPNCRCTLAPFTPRKADIGKLPTAPADSLKGSATRKESANTAQKSFENRIEKDPLRYAQQLSESAARRGFGGTGMPVPPDLVGQKIPGLRPGEFEVFAPKRALAEDVVLKRRIDDGSVTTRAELRAQVASTLRAGAKSATAQSSSLVFQAEGWRVTVDGKTGLVVNAERIGAAAVKPAATKTPVKPAPENDLQPHERILKLSEKAERELAPLQEKRLAIEQEVQQIISKGPDQLDAVLAASKKMGPLLEQIKRVKEESKREIIAALEVENPAKLTVKYESKFKKSDPRLDAVQKGVEQFSKFIGTGTVDGKDIVIQAARRNRASCGASTVYAPKSITAETVTHELGHWLEHNDPSVQKKAIAFLQKRTAGEALQRLKDLFPGHGYKKSERTRKDKFIHPYMGKDYSNYAGIYATEIVSMGLELFHKDPVKFARADAEYFNFIFNLVRGK